MTNPVASPTDYRRVKWELIILACMYVGYMAFVHCRTAIQVSGPSMLLDPELGLTKTLFGQILAWGTAGMVAGKLVNGLVSDAFGGRRVFLLALISACGMAFVMSYAGSYVTFAAANFIMLFSAAAGWPAMASLIAAWYPPAKYGKVWGLVSTASRLSSVLSMLLLGFLISKFSWPAIFQISAGIGFLVVILIFVLLKAKPSDVGLSAPQIAEPVAGQTPQTANHPLTGLKLLETIATFLKSGRVWLMCISLMMTTVMMEFIGFIPLYIQESFNVSASVAASATSVFPAGCLVALIGGGFIYDRVTRKGRIALLGGMLTVTTACIGLLWILPSLPIAPNLKLMIAIATLFSYGLTVAPAYYLPMSIFSIEYGGPRCGFLIGLIDAAGYAASMIYQYTGGSMVDRAGWTSMLALLFVCSLVAVLATVWFAYQDYQKGASHFSGMRDVK